GRRPPGRPAAGPPPPPRGGVVAPRVAKFLHHPARRARMGKIGEERINGQLAWRNSQASLLAAYAAACRTAIDAGRRQRR
ncbi:hypothetical protein ACFXA8_29620, partial [Streptomyces sp. NPDC059409]